MNISFPPLKIIFTKKIASTTFLIMALLNSTYSFAQNMPAQKTLQNTQTVNTSPKYQLKETRQVLQLAEYIGVDYPAAVKNGQISNKDEYAEMQQFATIISDKISKLSPPKSELSLTSLALQQAVNNKESATNIQKYSQAIRKQLLTTSPALILPKHLLPNKQVHTLFKENCSSCHGNTGAGNGVLAKTLTPEPTNFTDQTRAMNRSLLGLYDAITNGLDGSAMRSFNHLNERQRWSLAFYVGSLAFKPQQKLDTASLPQIDLTTWVNNNPNNLIKHNVNMTNTLLNNLRSEPNLLFSQNKSPLQTTKLNLLAAISAYKNNQLAQAQSLAVSAYLDGFELVENNLDAHDSVLRKSIEKQLLTFRDLLKTTNQQPQIDQELTQILRQLNAAENMLITNKLSNNSMFSAALIILLREGLEALLVVIALATVLIKTKRKDALKYLHFGWVLALIAGLFTWWAAENLINISGASREVMEGGAAILAALVLFYVGYWMHSKTQASQWQSYIKNNVNRHLTAGTLWGIAGLAFISVYREVFETVLFYQSLLTQANSEQMSVVVSGLLTGIATLALIAWLMIRYSVKLPISKFFSISAYFMLVLAFILTGKGIAALQEAAIIDLSPFPVDLSISWLGVTATWQGLMAQSTIIILSALLMFKNNSQTSPIDSIEN